MYVLYWSGIFLSVIGTTGTLVLWVRGRSQETRWWTRLMAMGALAMGASLFAGYIRTWRMGMMPVAGAVDSFALLGWTLLLSSLYLSRLPRFLGLSSLLGITGALSAAVAVFLPTRSLPSLAGANAIVFSSHVLVLFLAMASFVIAFFSGIFYLVAQRALKNKNVNGWLLYLPSLEALDHIVLRSVRLGFVALCGGMISGIYLAHAVWSTQWISDPKFILTSVTCAWYLLLLVLREVLGWRGGRFFFMMMIGFILLMITFVGTAIFFASRASPYAIQEFWRLAWIWS